MLPLFPAVTWSTSQRQNVVPSYQASTLKIVETSPFCVWCMLQATSKLRPPHPSADWPLLRMRGCFSEVMPQCSPPTWSKFTIVRVLLTFLEVCKFTTFCDRKGYRDGSKHASRFSHSNSSSSRPSPATGVFHYTQELKRFHTKIMWHDDTRC